MAQRWLLLLVGAGLLALGGCTGTSPGAAPETTTREGHAARYLGPVEKRYEYAEPGLTMTAPAAGRHAGASWLKAFGACFSGPVQCVATGDAVVSLASVTGLDTAGAAALGGHRMLDDTLMYVVTWDPADCRTLVPVDTSHPAGSACRVVDLITAEQVNGLPAGSHVYTFVIPETAPFVGG